ncbi:hypothetical protein FHS85_002266 [Rhodoligotrophos appendicifer]|uniref:O-antigen ligase family protein n=1 Tax=Rhodoligotrophos appendicifer TaxID=987056 RepID=UPI001186AA67|nr:O-antigen ligase family protein [Rhodoligotrophos appendicifer]
MSLGRAEGSKYLLGLGLLLALLVGGGTASGLYTDLMIQIWVLVASAGVLYGTPTPALDRKLHWLFLAIASLFVLQLLPWPSAWLAPLRAPLLSGLSPPDGPRFGFISSAVNRTLECAVYVGAGLGMFWAVLKLRPDQVVGLLPFFFIGVICNLLAATIQYSLAEDVSVEGFLPFTIKAGFFANVNHFSSLIYVSIPLMIFYGLSKSYYRATLLLLATILLFLLAAGSRAGAILGLLITLSAVFLLSARSNLRGVVVVLAFTLVSLYAIGVWSKLTVETLDPEFGRTEFASTTVAGIKENWPVGVGFGTFQTAYQLYERGDMIFQPYVNHAHNEYLELTFEGGVLTVVAILAYLVLLFLRFVQIRGNPLQQAAFLSLLFILLHSLVDYPLRTMALFLTFSVLNGIVFHRGFDRQGEPAQKAAFS